MEAVLQQLSELLIAALDLAPRLVVAIVVFLPYPIQTVRLRQLTDEEPH